MSAKPIFEKWFMSQQGFAIGCTTAWEKHPLWTEDPVMQPFRSAARTGRLMGYAGPPSRMAAEVLSKYIQVHHCRYVRQGGAGHARRGGGEMGRGRNQKGL